jgi:S-adenosylmethionine hydrolase
MDKPPILTLLSDFGDRDVYVGVMKGVIFQINRQISVVDLTHQIPPQNIPAARFCLMNAYPYFPAGTVHLAVVDPGVGGKRRAIALQLPQGFLVGPDNGIFSGIFSQYPVISAVELTNMPYWLTPEPSSTFHGRDIFAPIAAHLASGVTLQQLGREINPESLVKLNISKCQQTATGIKGSIQYIDHFGNLVSNIPASNVVGRNWCVKVAGFTIPGCTTYCEVEIGSNVALIGSHGWVEIATNGGNAHIQLQINLGGTAEVILN